MTCNTPVTLQERRFVLQTACMRSEHATPTCSVNARSTFLPTMLPTWFIGTTQIRPVAFPFLSGWGLLGAGSRNGLVNGWWEFFINLFDQVAAIDKSMVFFTNFDLYFPYRSHYNSLTGLYWMIIIDLKAYSRSKGANLLIVTSPVYKKLIGIGGVTKRKYVVAIIKRTPAPSCAILFSTIQWKELSETTETTGSSKPGLNAIVWICYGISYTLKNGKRRSPVSLDLTL